MFKHILYWEYTFHDPGLLSQAQKEAVGAETDLGQELNNGQDEMDDREYEHRYEIEKRGSINENGRKWFSSCPRWRAKSRKNNQVGYGLLV